ncbi:MAG TPA: endonuclease/exonuclease/phosphatase family protein, partial [Gemmatimonadota bacterium]|nr:endonuclease/exonuclease/phosphatase family protein [Gemmatimonadota bacterium]
DSSSAPAASAPDTSLRAAAPGTLRILAYNIRHGEGMDSVINLIRVARFIERLAPDIVTLQEIDSAVERTFGVNQMAVLGELTGMEAAFGGFFDYQGGRYGMGILSKHPLLSYDNHRLPDGLEPRTALAARIEVDEVEVVVVSIHLYATAEERYAQAERLVEILEGEGSPVILAGDFNSTPDSEVIALLARHWEIANKGDDHFTFPSNSPEREIDYIMYRPADRFTVVEHRVIAESLISDHRPLLLDLQLR